MDKIPYTRPEVFGSPSSILSRADSAVWAVGSDSQDLGKEYLNICY